MSGQYNKIYATLTAAIISFMAIVSCGKASDIGGQHHSAGSGDNVQLSDTLNTLVGKWSHYRSIGRQDSVIITAMPWLNRFISSNDTLGIQYTGISIAQAYVLLDRNYDSTKNFIDRIRPYFEQRPNPRAASMFWSTLGHFALKYELDYPKALQYYLNAMEASQALGYVNSQIVMLYNIVNIFYIRSDRHGYKYAETALKLSQTDTAVNTFSKIAAYLGMAQMLYLQDKAKEALEYLQEAYIMALSENVTYYEPIIQLTYGDIFSAHKDFSRAEACYRQALAASTNTEPSTITLIYLSHGKMYEQQGKYDSAIELYLQGLKTSTETHNMEFREELLKRISELLYNTGRDELAASYYRQYTELLNNLEINDKEQEFTGKLLSYSEMRHEYETALKDLELSERKRWLLATTFIIFALAIAVSVTIYLYIRQKNVTRMAVRRYEEYRRRLISENRKQQAIASENKGIHTPESSMEKLYLQIENLMHDGLFRNKDLSLEKLAGILGSNRTYVSNTINKMAGTSFYTYLDTYRIKEATRILSDSCHSANISLKQLADDIGYNSPQVFNKAFKKETGTTPGAYKSEVLKISEEYNMNNQ